MINATRILLNYRKSQKSRFHGIRTPRVSMIGYCNRMHVAKVLGIISSDIPTIYTRSGYALQDFIFHELQAVYPNTQQELIVRTTVEGAETHPDIYIPEIRHGIQVKGDNENSTFGASCKAHKEQALLEWHFWRLAGCCMNEDGTIFTEVPKTYELLYAGRESWGENTVSLPIKYELTKARFLQERYEDLMDYIEMEMLPEPLSAKGSDCGFCALKCFE